MPTNTKTAPAPAPAKKKPAHVINRFPLKATIWENPTDNGSFFSVNLTRTFKDDEEQYQDSNSFNADDLLVVAKLANEADSWIADEKQRRYEANKR